MDENNDQELFFGSKSNYNLTNPLNNSSGAKFRVFNINGNSGSFEYIGSPINEHWFEGVCNIRNKEISLNGFNYVKTIEPGTVSIMGDEVKVTKVAKIIFTNDNNVSMSQPQSQGSPNTETLKTLLNIYNGASDEIKSLININLLNQMLK